MNEDIIVVTISDYRGKKITLTMPDYTMIDMWKSQIIMGENIGKYNQIGIEMTCKDGIDIKEEELV